MWKRNLLAKPRWLAEFKILDMFTVLVYSERKGTSLWNKTEAGREEGNGWQGYQWSKYERLHIPGASSYSSGVHGEKQSLEYLRYSGWLVFWDQTGTILPMFMVSYPGPFGIWEDESKKKIGGNKEISWLLPQATYLCTQILASSPLPLFIYFFYKSIKK